MTIPTDMHAAIEACYERCEARVDEYAKRLVTKSPPETIYHYTNLDGLQGVLKSGKLWLTDIFGQNDTSELRYGVRHACDCLDVEAPRIHPVGTMLARQFRDLCETGLPSVARYFVGCFSLAKNDLDQWRKYADNARGFSLGF